MSTAIETKQENAPVVEQKDSSSRVYAPAVDIYETNDHFVVVADLPGVNQSTVDITVEKNVLTIEGKVQEKVLEGLELSYSEFGVGDYYRAFTLSDDVDRDNIHASVSNGTLTLRLPKIEPSKKRITVVAS